MKGKFKPNPKPCPQAKEGKCHVRRHGPDLPLACTCRSTQEQGSGSFRAPIHMGLIFLVPQFYLALKLSCGTNTHQRRSLLGEEEANELN